MTVLGTLRGTLGTFRGTFSGLIGGAGRLGIELGNDLTAVELKGDPPSITAAGESAHAGYSGAELGAWMRRWLRTIGATTKSAHTVVVQGDIHHYLVRMPEMSDGDRHLAAGAELRKQSGSPVGHFAYSHATGGYVEDEGATKQQVMIAAVDHNTMRNTVDAIEGAGLHADLITTVPSALIRAAELMTPSSGGMAMAYLSDLRCYLVVFQDGVVELIRDFVLHSDSESAEAGATSDVIAAELRRSFLYFGQRAQGATVERLVLTGPFPNLVSLTGDLAETLAVDVELFDCTGHVDHGGELDPADQAALAAALGAAALSGASMNLISPEIAKAERVDQMNSLGRWVAGAAVLFLLAWGVLALITATTRNTRLESIQQQVTQTRPALE